MIKLEILIEVIYFDLSPQFDLLSREFPLSIFSITYQTDTFCLFNLYPFRKINKKYGKGFSIWCLQFQAYKLEWNVNESCIEGGF